MLVELNATVFPQCFIAEHPAHMNSVMLLFVEAFYKLGLNVSMLPCEESIAYRNLSPKTVARDTGSLERPRAPRGRCGLEKQVEKVVRR